MAVRETDPEARHPLAPLIRAWLDRPREVEPYRPVNRASLPRLHRVTGDEAARLPGIPNSGPAPGEQFDLPGFGPVVQGCPSWLLWMFDQAGGESMSAGRGAPWLMRLFVGALIHVAMRDRTGRWITVRLPNDDAPASPERPAGIHTWLHPHPRGWWPANKRRDWHRFPATLDAMRERLAYVPVPDIGSVAMLFPSVIPREPSDPFVEFTVRIPSAAAHGARLDWPLLCRYGLKSAAQYRAYLSTIAYFDHSARAGHPITADIAAPVLDDEGNPKRRKGGAIIRSSHDTVPNPAARYVAPLTDADLARMIGFDGDNRDHRRQARRAFERLDADGIVDMQRKGSGVYLFGPRKGAR